MRDAKTNTCQGVIQISPSASVWSLVYNDEDLKLNLFIDGKDKKSFDPEPEIRGETQG
jgi:hypothetical protein